MRSLLSRWSVTGAVVGSLLLGISGCKSGATSTSDWLSWGKKPSHTALSSTAPKKPSSTGYPSPRATTGQTSLASNTNQGQQPYGASSDSNAPGYNTGPYGMASHSTTPGANGSSPYGGAQFATNTTTPQSGSTSPYGSTAAPQTGAYPVAGDNDYRTADTRSAATGSHNHSGNIYGGGQQAPESSPYGQPAPQDWENQGTSSYPTAGSTQTTTGLNTGAGPFQPGSTGTSQALPVNAGASVQGNTSYPGTTPPTGYPSSSSSSYPATSYPATSPSTYPAANATNYPATGGTGQAYPSQYPSSGY